MENINSPAYEELRKDLAERQARIDALCQDGEKRIKDLGNEIRSVRNNRQIPKETKAQIIDSDKKMIEEAKAVKASKKEELAKERASFYVAAKKGYQNFLDEKKAANKAEKESAAALRKEALAKAAQEHQSRMAALREKKAAGASKEEIRSETIAMHKAYDLAKEDAESAYSEKVTNNKDDLHSLYLERSNAIKDAYDGHAPIQEKIADHFENYRYKFSLRDFIFNNGLYFVILLAVILVTVVYAATNGKFLFTWPVILTILEQSSPRLFFSLGVAGLIILAGTDLSVGRMIGMGGVLTVMFCTTSGIPEITFAGASLDFSAIPLGLRVVFGFLLSTIACAFFSCLAGFFTAKFKMHPFISTLANQLMIFGGMVLLTDNGYTGMPDNNVIKNLTGRIGGGITGFPIMIIYAVVLVAVMWFIWNKTKFGKNMFAVGGNPEAAAVSGINVFWTTMGVFLMAGILYGLGSSIFGIYSTSVKAQNGQGMESDAIAACVVGGVSFSGGVGTIHGVVIGTLLFQAIAYILPFIGIGDSNAQLFIKGLIILIAVTFDCAKFLKKK